MGSVGLLRGSLAILASTLLSLAHLVACAGNAPKQSTADFDASESLRDTACGLPCSDVEASVPAGHDAEGDAVAESSGPRYVVGGTLTGLLPGSVVVLLNASVTAVVSCRRPSRSA